VSASATSLASDLAPFEAAIAAGIPLIMLSNATYTAYDKGNAAGWSPAIVGTLLRDTLGFRGVSITDSLSGIAAARDVSSRSLALKALAAGTDMVMITGSESSTDATYDYLVSKVESGALPIEDRHASYDRIVALKTSRAIGGIRGQCARP
jgi:beta-N-acetylhexosaminidase